MLRQLKEVKNFGIKNGGLFFSNSVEVLLEHLKLTLFADIKDPFSQHMLVVPSQGMEQWIQLQLASSLHIACGYKTTFLNKSIDILCETFFPEQKKAHLPKQTELLLKILEQIELALVSGEEMWQPLLSYIDDSGKRKIALARQLCQLFNRYGVYAGAATSLWEEKPQDWQQALWANVFKIWDYPGRALLDPAFTPSTTSSYEAIHLFAFSHLSSLHFNFFCKISQQIPVYVYHVFPCQEYCSDYYDEKLPSLLRALGKTSRQMATLFEQSDSLSEESYLIFSGQSALRTLQRELLTLQQEEIQEPDDSIELHSFTTAHHEIEHLCHTLGPLFAAGKIKPCDVIVAACDIDRYLPYIEALFTKAHIPYRIEDLSFLRYDELSRVFLQLLNLEKNRFGAPFVLELLEHPLFASNHHLSKEDLTLIRKWVAQTGISWGFNAAHRDELLKKNHCTEAMQDGLATWQEALGLLIEELALADVPNRVSYSEAELLGTLYSLISALYSDLQMLEERRNLLEWSGLLSKLLEKYFGVHESVKIFSAFFEQLNRAALHFPDTSYSFDLIYPLLESYLDQQQTHVNRSLCHAVRFCSMMPMRLVPAKVICLLGLNHDTFPRKEHDAQLNLLNENRLADYAPSSGDLDRAMFLEALISAREKLYLSYVGRDPYEHTELPPSSILYELLSSCVHKTITHHPNYETRHLHINELPSLRFASHALESSLLSGHAVIDVQDLVRLVRSPLAHYLAASNLRIPEDWQQVLHEEPFTLSAWHKSILWKTFLREGPERAEELGIRMGAFPLGINGQLVRQKLNEEWSRCEKISVKQMNINPLHIKVTDSLSATLIGTLEGVIEEGLAVVDKCSVKNAIKTWPLYLVLQASDPSKKNLFFLASHQKKELFFDDAYYFLKKLITLYFYAKQNPVFLSYELIEAFLKQDSKLLSEAAVYDKTLRWQLLGHKKLCYEEWLTSNSALVEYLFKEMYDAWF